RSSRRIPSDPCSRRSKPAPADGSGRDDMPCGGPPSPGRGPGSVVLDASMSLQRGHRPTMPRPRHLALSALSFLLFLPGAVLLTGCGEEEAPPVEIENIDFEKAQQEATKEYGGGPG